jgi:hypothetical protein
MTQSTNKDIRHLLKQPNVISIETARKRVQPPPDLTAEELRIFQEVVESRAPSHFRESDNALLLVYCAAVNLSRLYAEHWTNDVGRRMKIQTAKLVALIANRLRISP